MDVDALLKEGRQDRFPIGEARHKRRKVDKRLTDHKLHYYKRRSKTSK